MNSNKIPVITIGDVIANWASMTYFLLIRRISPYTHANILLGVFSSEMNAIKTRECYYNQRYIEVPQNTSPRASPKKNFFEKLFVRSPIKEPSEIVTDISRDPWYHQCYKDNGLTIEDLIIEEINIDSLYGQTRLSKVFVVSTYSDYMGQIMREFDSLYPTENAANQRLDVLRKALDEFDEENSPDVFPANLFSIQTTYMDTLLSDSPQNQPKLR